MAEATFRVRGGGRSTRRGRWRGWWLVLPLLTGCASTGVPEQQVKAEEARLLQPFQADRTVVADEVHIDLSANLDDEVARPAAGKRSLEDGDIVFRWITPPGMQTPLRFQIGNTRLFAMRSATLRVRGSGKPVALAAQAVGQATEAVGNGSPVDCSEVKIEDGRYARR